MDEEFGKHTAAHDRAPVAGSTLMADLSRIAEDYLALRGRLGHALAEAHWLLPKFVAYLEQTGAEYITIGAALAWAQGPDVDPATTMAARRMTIARGLRGPEDLGHGPRSSCHAASASSSCFSR